MGGNETNEFWKTFLEGTVLAPWVPDEVTDTERGEVFTGIPRGQAGGSPPAFVLPDAFADSLGIGRGNIDCSKGRNCGYRGYHQDHTPAANDSESLREQGRGYSWIEPSCQSGIGP